MPNTYKTPTAIAGAKRRQQDYHARLRKSGQKPRSIWATNKEIKAIKEFLAGLRKKNNT